MKKVIALLLSVCLIFTTFTGCGAGSAIESVSVSERFAFVYIKESVKWDELDDEEKMEIAKEGVDRCFNEATNRDEMKKIIGCQWVGISRNTVFLYHSEDYPDITVDKDIVAAYDEAEKQSKEEALYKLNGGIEHVLGIELSSVESGVAYYNVSLLESTTWKWHDIADDERTELIYECINFAIKNCEDDGVYRYVLRAKIKGGSGATDPVAFVWLGDDIITIFDNDGNYSSHDVPISEDKIIK